MKRLALGTILALTVLAPARAQRPAPQPELNLESFLVVGKASGACGILTLQLNFQETTKMSGGNEFIVRFWTTEAARLGMTLDKYAEHCQTSLSSYDKLLEMAETAR